MNPEKAKITYNKRSLQNKFSFNNRPMSTSSKIIQNHIENVKNTKNQPKKSLPFPSSPQLTPRSRKDSNSEEDESLDREELLLLEIRQIKRQNKFLKKKIQDLLEEMNGDAPKKKKNNKGVVKQSVDSVHLTVDFFFQEINNLINSIVELFKVEFSQEEVEIFSKKYPEEEDILEPTKKYMSFKKFTLNRKLQKILLEKEEKRYCMLLDVFTEYYRIKDENEKHVIKVIDNMTTKALDLNKMIVQKAQERKSLKVSGVRSQNNEKNEKLEMENLKLPFGFNRVSSPGSVTSQHVSRKKQQPVTEKKVKP